MQRSVDKILKKLHDSSNTRQGPSLMNGHRLSVKITKLECAPTAKSFSLPKIKQKQNVLTTHTRTTDTVNTIEPEKPRTSKKTDKPMFQEKIKQETNGEDAVQIDETQSEDGDGGHLHDLVYDAVLTGQSPDELEGDGWHADESREAVTWREMAVFERSQEHGLSLALGFGIF